jgi:hypothetical protein
LAIFKSINAGSIGSVLPLAPDNPCDYSEAGKQCRKRTHLRHRGDGTDIGVCHGVRNSIDRAGAAVLVKGL